MKSKTMFFCTECGNETPKWAGHCSACGAWNSIVEQPEQKKSSKIGKKPLNKTSVKLENITDLHGDEEIRFSTGMRELDRVLGGGAVKGSLVLVGGAPGIGKSTLMLQICKKLGEQFRVLYISGEESVHQLKLRAKRLQAENEKERTRGNLLRAVGHDLRTPLTAISGAINTVLEQQETLPAEKQRELLKNAEEESQWLIHMGVTPEVDNA